MNIKETYNRIAEDWVKDHHKDTWGKPGADMFMSFLSKGASVLDVGCGGGNKTKYISDHGYKASGVDISEKMIEIAQREYPELNFSVLDMYDIDKYPETVDGLFVQAALLHIQKSRVYEVLEKLYSKLNKGGHIYISVKSKREGGVDEETKTENDYGYEYSRYFSYYTPEELKEYFTKLGFEIVWEDFSITDASKWIQFIAKK